MQQKTKPFGKGKGNSYKTWNLFHVRYAAGLADQPGRFASSAPVMRNVRPPKRAVYRRLLIPVWDQAVFLLMRIISRRTLKEFWERHPDAEQPLQAWYADVRQAHWRSPSDVKSVYRNASFMTNKLVVFNIKGNT